jgi:hypothetical protein
VIGLVYWSFVVALTPLALGLAWKLVLGIQHATAHEFARVFEHAEPRGMFRPEAWDPPSGSLAVTGECPWRGAARS